MKKLYKIAICIIALGAIFSCVTEEVGLECIECNTVRLLCEGDDDGNGGVINKADLELAIEEYEKSGLSGNCVLVDK